MIDFTKIVLSKKLTYDEIRIVIPDDLDKKFKNSFYKFVNY